MYGSIQSSPGWACSTEETYKIAGGMEPVARQRRVFKMLKCILSRGSSVSVVTRLRAGRLEFDSLSLLPCQDRLWVPPRLLSNRYRGVMRPGRGADHSPPSSADIKNACKSTSSLPYVFMAECLIKAQDAFRAWFLVSTEAILPLYLRYECVNWSEMDGSVGTLGTIRPFQP
jgi:hypothetical protein